MDRKPVVRFDRACEVAEAGRDRNRARAEIVSLSAVELTARGILAVEDQYYRGMYAVDLHRPVDEDLRESLDRCRVGDHAIDGRGAEAVGPRGQGRRQAAAVAAPHHRQTVGIGPAALDQRVDHRVEVGELGLARAAVHRPRGLLALAAGAPWVARDDEDAAARELARLAGPLPGDDLFIAALLHDLIDERERVHARMRARDAV